MLATPEVRPIGEEIDALWKLREGIRVVEEDLDKKKTLYEEKSRALMERLIAEGMDKASSTCASASVSMTVVPQVENWEDFYRYIRRNNAFHLLERRPAAKAYRELLEQRKEKPVPGVVSFTRRTLNLRTL